MTVDPHASLRKDAPRSATSPPFKRVLIANRGEIALRILRTCRDLGIEVVAVYSDADTGAAHVREADDSVRLGPAPAAESYLRGDAVIDAALQTRADAIHPGYGFLAESEAFARAVRDAGIAFVGPSPETIARLGNKLAARRLAQEVGVPVVPGTLDPVPVERPDEVAAVLREAERVGFPLLVKAAAGGGGRGMRRVDRAADLPAALVSGAREAHASFGDGVVYLEREIRPARHIEVQLLGDAAGTVVALGERDCSLQRRHQKLIEEAPAPGLSLEEREVLHELAVRVGRAAGLENAATAEFLFDGDRRFWFLEVNTRLQVEHGVTELTTGLDLVAEQLDLAAGRPLSAAALRASESAAEPQGHAIEIRLSAEDPARAFAPTPGTVTWWRMPAGPGIRVDSAIQVGDRVPPDYDPLVAKIMASGQDRATALARLARGLDEVEVVGLQTTLPFHRFVVRHPAFLDHDLSTEWVDEHWDGPKQRARVVGPAVLAVALAEWREGLQETSTRDESRATFGRGRSGSAGPGWRETGRAEMIDRWPI